MEKSQETFHTHLDFGMMELLYMKQEQSSAVAVAQRARDWYDSFMFPRFLCLDFLSETALQTALKKALKNRAGRRSFLKTHFLLGLFSTGLNPFL